MYQSMHIDIMMKDDIELEVPPEIIKGTSCAWTI